MVLGAAGDCGRGHARRAKTVSVHVQRTPPALVRTCRSAPRRARCPGGLLLRGIVLKPYGATSEGHPRRARPRAKWNVRLRIQAVTAACGFDSHHRGRATAMGTSRGSYLGAIYAGIIGPVRSNVPGLEANRMKRRARAARKSRRGIGSAAWWWRRRATPTSGDPAPLARKTRASSGASTSSSVGR